ncbi:MAG: hypothetical protein NT007_04565 [Candidatus Kapabacteria bacterium]|nr:hypothetical protein [Candidatus Kapabacteria bacterium]
MSFLRMSLYKNSQLLLNCHSCACRNPHPVPIRGFLHAPSMTEKDCFHTVSHSGITYQYHFRRFLHAPSMTETKLMK